MAKVAKEATDTDKKPAKRKTAAEMRQAQRTKQQQQRTGFDQTRDNAHGYLKQWATDRENWKFNSAKQRWIVQHLYMDALMPANIFDIALDYLSQSKAETFRTSMIDDARLIADPMLANNSDGAQKSRRARALGLLPSHVTKAESKATKKATKKAAKGAKLADPAADAKADGDKISEDDEGPNNDADQEQSTAEVSETACQRATRVIEALSEQPNQSNDKGGSKRKRTDDDDDEEPMLKKKEHKKKAKEDEGKKRREERAMRKEEKEKIKAEKRAEKEQKKARKIEKEKKKAEKAQKKRAS